MSKKTLKDSDLKQLLADVATEVEGLVKAEAATLAKAHPGEDTSAEVSEDESATDPQDSGPPPAEASSAPPGGDAPPMDDGASAAPPAGDDGSAPPAGPDAAAAGGDPAADQSMDPEALKAEYAQMPPEMLKAHYLAAKEALFATMGAPGADATGAAPPADPMASAGAPPAPPAAAPPAPDAPPALKAEKGMTEHVDANGENPLTAVKKSEAKYALLETQVGILTQAMTKILTTPVRKSIASITEVAKTTSVDVSALSKAQIDEKLKEIVRTPLKKSDREKINSYVLGKTQIDQIAHLFGEKN